MRFLVVPGKAGTQLRRALKQGIQGGTAFRAVLEFVTADCSSSFLFGLFLAIWLIHHLGLACKRAVAYILVLCGLLWNSVGVLVPGYVGTSLGGYFGSHFVIKKANSGSSRL